MYKRQGWWVTGSESWEVISQSSGLCVTDFPEKMVNRSDFVYESEYHSKKMEESKKIEDSYRTSKLCKKAFFERYKSYCQKIEKRVPGTYLDCKNRAIDYHMARMIIKRALLKSDLGAWPQKPLNTDLF